ncbi:hypothetical protein [Bacillus cereus group sp. MYBK215-1]|uniref:hypothetical protein n=1 Tax=unclassified Bacillus cereus group TaxID=2750818 RepID=UPI003F7B2B4B
MNREERGKQLLEEINLRQVQKHLGKGRYIIGDWEAEVKPDDYYIAPLTHSPQLVRIRRQVELYLPDGVKVTIEKEVQQWKQ